MDFHQHTEEKMRIIQELVPGKQVTLAHIIANPDASLYEKISLEPALVMRMAPPRMARLAL